MARNVKGAAALVVVLLSKNAQESTNLRHELGSKRQRDTDIRTPARTRLSKKRALILQHDPPLTPARNSHEGVTPVVAHHSQQGS